MSITPENAVPYIAVKDNLDYRISETVYKNAVWVSAEKHGCTTKGEAISHGKKKARRAFYAHHRRLGNLPDIEVHYQGSIFTWFFIDFDGREFSGIESTRQDAKDKAIEKLLHNRDVKGN